MGGSTSLLTNYAPSQAGIGEDLRPCTEPLPGLRRLSLVAAQTPTTLSEKPIKIGAKVVHRSRAVTFQLAEVAVPRALFAAILERIGWLRTSPQSV